MINLPPLSLTATETVARAGRSYLTITLDFTRVMSRIKALYRSWAIGCSGTTVYAARHRSEWLAKISESGVCLRAERLYQQLNLLQPLHQEARRDFVMERLQASSREVIAPESIDRSGTGCVASGPQANWHRWLREPGDARLRVVG